MRLIVCNGQPKSGSTFFFVLAKRLVSHRECSADDPIVAAARAASPALDRIVHHSDGHFTGYLHGTIAQAAAALTTIPLTSAEALIVKMHDKAPPPADALPIPTTIVTTFRDPADVMVALRDQSRREALRQPDEVRRTFLEMDDYASALGRAARFLEHLAASFSPANWYLEYPAFIRPSTAAMAAIGRALHVDPRAVETAAATLDQEIRGGNVWGEFNRGEVGRGRAIIADLVRDGVVAADLAQRGEAAYHGLVDAVRRHGCGITTAC